MKTADLEYKLLDLVVKQIEDGRTDGIKDYSPSTNWAQGGPIIEREGINLEHNPSRCIWIASTPAPEHRNGAVEVTGPTPLIAAMRCYVASKLGDGVEIPDTPEQLQAASRGELCPVCHSTKVKFVGWNPDGIHMNCAYNCTECDAKWEGK